MSYPYDAEKSAYDTEKGPSTRAYGGYDVNDAHMYEDGAVPGESFVHGDTLYHRLQRLAGKFNMEQRGIERVPESERTDDGFRALLNVSTMVCTASLCFATIWTDSFDQWLSANMVVSSFAIGLLAKPVFYLGTVDAMLVVLFFNLLGILPVCFFSCFGPVFGLRQMILSRFWFGYYGTKLSKFLATK